MRIYIQTRDDGSWLSPAAYALWHVFNYRGKDVIPFTYEQLRDGIIKPTIHDIVHGGIGSVRLALKMLGAKEPENFDLPKSLAGFLGRRTWISTMAAVRGIERYEPPIHVKPLHGHKVFTGRLLKRRDDLLFMTTIPGELEVLVQECVNFKSEFRFYVLNGEVVGVGFYNGDPLELPSSNVVRSMLKAFADAPVAYGLDVGVTDKGETLLVETNDAFSLGFYGISMFKYADMVEARWNQLIRQLNEVPNG